MARVSLAAWLSLTATCLSAGASSAQVAETFIYDVHGRMTGSTDVNAAGAAGWAGYTLDAADNVSTRSAASVSFPSTPSRLLQGEYITLQQTIYSPDDNVSLALRSDGDLVLSCGTAVKWSSGTSGSQAQFLAVQPGDGHLVLFGPNYTPVWFNGVWGYSGMFLQVQDDGNLVAYSAGGIARWATGTSCGGGGGGAEIIPASLSTTSNYAGYTGLTTVGGMRDGNFNSVSSIHGTNNGPTEIIQANLGTAQSVSRIDIASADATAPGGWGSPYTNNAVVEYSADGVNWTTVGTISGVVDGAYTSINMGGATMLYIRIVMSYNWLGLGDFRVYQ